MATDIVPSITPVYTAVVPVPDDADAVTGAGLVNFALPLANRIEFLNARVNTAPWVQAEMFDDFLVVDDSVAGFLQSKELWVREDNTESSYTTSSGGTAPTVGELRIQNVGANAGELKLGTGSLWPIDKVSSITVRLKVAALLTGQNLEIALDIVSGDAIDVTPASSLLGLICFDSGSWAFRTHRTSNASVAVPSSAMVANTYMQLQINHDGAGGWTASSDGGTVATAVSQIPADGTLLKLSIKAETPNAGSRTVSIDFIHIRALPAARVL